MDAELKAKWVEALRSGEYKQTKFQLSDARGYCCLGVLCRVAGIAIVNGESCDGAEPGDGYGPLRKIVGRPFVPELTFQNDGDDKGFPEIADYIEANIPGDEAEPCATPSTS